MCIFIAHVTPAQPMFSIRTIYRYPLSWSWPSYVLSSSSILLAPFYLTLWWISCRTWCTRHVLRLETMGRMQPPYLQTTLTCWGIGKRPSSPRLALFFALIPFSSSVLFCFICFSVPAAPLLPYGFSRLLPCPSSFCLFSCLFLRTASPSSPLLVYSAFSTLSLYLESTINSLTLPGMLDPTRPSVLSSRLS